METSNIKVEDFVLDAFDYLNKLGECSIDLSVNRYLLEHIAHGFVMYGCTPEAFIANVDKWVRSLVKIYPELGFNHETKQVIATIDLIDQMVIIDEELIKALEYIIDIQTRYGFLITYKCDKRNINNTTTIARFFEFIEKMYPVIKDRYKGLGSSPAKVSKEVIMDPRTRRIVRVTIDDIDTMTRMGILIGDGKENKAARKEMLMNFRFSKSDIDN